MPYLKKNLTLQFSLHQLFYWAVICCIYSFASSYLTERGYSPATIGIILFSANFLSFALQPVVGSIADKAKRNLLRPIMFFMSVLSFICVFLLRFVPMPAVPFSILYLLGITFMDMQVPLLNAENVFYTGKSWTINYGLGRACGSLSFSVVSLIMGYVMRDFGAEWMPLAALLFIALYAVTTLFFPKDDEKLADSSANGETSSLFVFFSKYKWYCISLFGVLFMALFHVMVENYLIQILERIGGDSSGVGIALFIATLVETPMMILFLPIHKKLGSHKVLILAAFFYSLKALLFILAKAPVVLYVAQTLQGVTYTFLSPVQMYYAEECTSEADMIKGQSVITAIYALGCALGNLIGGALISAFGVPALLYFGLGITLLSLLTVLVTVPKALRKV